MKNIKKIFKKLDKIFFTSKLIGEKGSREFFIYYYGTDPEIFQRTVKNELNQLNVNNNKISYHYTEQNDIRFIVIREINRKD